MQLLENLDTAKQKLANFNFVGEEKIMDTYFYDPNLVLCQLKIKN